MKVSELIEKLADLEAQHGDVRVFMDAYGVISVIDSFDFDPKYGILIQD